MKQTGNGKVCLYYITEFGAPKIQYNESVDYFSKRFNKMYYKIPAEIKPKETSSKLTFANAFDAYFSLLLRERRVVTLINMHEVALEVKSNLLVVYRLRVKPQYQDIDERK